VGFSSRWLVNGIVGVIVDTSIFGWDYENIRHIARHNVAPAEAEEVMLGDPLDIEFEIVDGEERWSYLGETSDERILWVTITFRNERMRIVTAFEPKKQLKDFYLKTREGQL
jgi:uncharacterized DUF497 family protein